MENRILNVLRTALEMEDIDISLDDQFREYDEWDSLGQLSLIALLDEEFGVAIETDDFNELVTVRDLVNAVQKLSK